MIASYFDTSAAMKLIGVEAGSAELVEYLRNEPDRRLVSSLLLHTELHCAVGRSNEEIPRSEVESVLDQVELIELERIDLLNAGGYPPLRSHDAIHLAVALRFEVDEMITYDKELADAAQRRGIKVIAPGQS